MPTPPHALAEIRRLYHDTTPATIERDLRRAIDLLKSLPGEAERLAVAGYMDGLSQLRSEWILAGRRAGQKKTGSAPSPRKARRR